MPAQAMSLKSVEVMGRSWWMWSIWRAGTHIKKKRDGGGEVLEAHFKLVAWSLKSKSFFSAFPDVLEDHAQNGANLSWWLAHRKGSA